MKTEKSPVLPVPHDAPVEPLRVRGETGHPSGVPRSPNVKLKVNKNNFDLLTDNVSCQLIQYKPPKCVGLHFEIKININSILYPNYRHSKLKLGK